MANTEVQYSFQLLIAAQSCSNGTVRLAGGSLKSAGRVEIASMKCGGQCVMMDGIAMMQQLCADRWGTVSAQVQVS